MLKIYLCQQPQFYFIAGGLYLIWCDIDIITSSVETLILVLVYVFFFRNFVADYCFCVEAISIGKGSLEKLKNSFTTLVGPEISRVRTIDTRVLLSLNNCRFKSNEKVIFEVDLLRGEVLGVCGKHMKTLIYAILGQNECKDGIFRQRGTVGYNSEEAFVFIGSVKVKVCKMLSNFVIKLFTHFQDNILMGSDFDSKRYYTAVTITKLHEDVLLALGSDELSIESMDLTQQQKERIVLARAIYSDRDVYLFDEPFKSAVFSSNVLLLFADVVHQILASDPGKAIIVCSSNSQILNMCTKIYDTNENKIFSRQDYERFSAASFHEGSVHYTFENVKGSNPNALTVYKKQSRFHVEIVNENPVAQDESTEHLISKQKKEASNDIGIFNLSLISILTFTNCSVYVLLILGFIFVVMSSYIEPWLEFVFLASFAFAGEFYCLHFSNASNFNL